MLSLFASPFAGPEPQPFPTVAPPDSDFAPAFDATTPAPFVGFGEFLDASEIEMGPVTQDVFGWYGYATLTDDPTQRLIWYTDGNGVKHYQIVDETNPLLADFQTYVNNLIEAENKVVDAVGLYGAAWGSLILAQLAACGPSSGVTCITAAITAGIAIVGTGFRVLYTFIAEVLPAERNVVEQFDLIKDNPS